MFQVTTPVTSHVVYAGSAAALVDSGIAALAPDLLGSLEPLVAGEVSLQHILLTHAHFDHVGGIPYLRDRFPGVSVVGSPESAELLANRDTVRALYDLNAEAATALDRPFDLSYKDWVSAVRIDTYLSEGDTLDLGDGVDVKIVACPGHTVDTVGYYARSELALAAGEAAGGYYGRDRLAPCFLSSYEDYLQTLDKLSGLDIRIFSLPHGGALTGELVKRFLTEARVAAERLYQTVKDRLDAGDLQEGIVTELFSEWGIEGFTPDGPFVSAQKQCLTRMVRLVAEEFIDME